MRRVDAAVSGPLPAEDEAGWHGSADGESAQWPWWQPWFALAFFAFLVNFVWEMVTAPLYAGLADGPHWYGVRCCLMAAAGDAVIALVAYGVVALLRGDRDWMRARSSRQFAASIAGYLVVGVVITVIIERLSVYTLERWAYTSTMPTLGGIGVAPLLQWILLPPVVLWLAWRHQRPLLESITVDSSLRRNPSLHDETSLHAPHLPHSESHK